MSKIYKIGARSSPLSMLQAEQTLEKINHFLPDFSYELQPFCSPGDRDQKVDLSDTAGNFFTEDLDKAVLNGEVDFAIHSAKDLPSPIAPSMDWLWFPWVEDKRDVLILPLGKTLADLPVKPKVGVSSERRRDYSEKKFPGYEYVAIRGTIQKRIEQLDAGVCDVLIMAGAALNRLGLQSRITEWIAEKELPPPEAQGAIAITFKAGNAELIRFRSLFIEAVRIVGAGPGDANLCTLGALNDLNWCDICLHDALISPDIFKRIPKHVRCINVGKRSQKSQTPQHEINQLLVDYTRKGYKVVRLKGGDPGIFGRLAEEVDALESLSLPYQVSPGLSSMNVATTRTGLMLTRRGLSRGFTAMTPRKAGGYLGDINKDTRAELPLVFFMALSESGNIAQQLQSEGRPSTEPVAIIMGAGTDNEKIHHTTLANLSVTIKEIDGNLPGLLIVGEVSDQKYRYKHCTGALAGKRVLLTCSRTIMNSAVERVRSLGGIPLAHPLISITKSAGTSETLRNMKNFDYVVLTSPSAVNQLVAQMKALKVDLRDIPLILSPGAKTTSALSKHGLNVHLEPTREYSDEALMEIVELAKGSKVLRLRSTKADSYVIDEFKKQGIEATDCILYENTSIDHETLPDFDAVFFASGSAAINFVDQWGADKLQEKVTVAIGNPTRDAMKKHHLYPTIISPVATVADSIFALAGYYINSDFK